MTNTDHRQRPVAVRVAAAPPQQWRRHLFDGGLLVLTGLAELQPILRHARSVLSEAFAPAPPAQAQEALEPDDFAARSDRVRAAFRRDAAAAALMLPLLRACGLELSHTFWDRLNLRVLPDGATPQHRSDLALGAHRDTWSSNIYAQINWWLPIHTLEATSAVAFYQRHWHCALANTSEDWDLDELRRQRRSGDAITVPLIPSPIDRPDPSDALVVVVEPGDVLLFSGAHLHATVPNTSGRPRYSIEMRTVVTDDVRHGHGAPNIDGAAPRVPWHWFTRVDDGTPLTADAG